ncbi:MAG TPA: stage II sporulation protein P [Clostridiales bacterium]|nr:stage II sporulation protein P [Clostridiales bacterium]
MIRIKVMRISGFMYYLIVIVLLAAIVFLSWRLLSGNPVQFNSAQEYEEMPEDYHAVNPVYKSMLGGGFAAIAAVDGGSGNLFTGLWNMITRRDLRDPKSIMSYPMPYLDYAPDLPDNSMGEAVEVVSNLPGRSSIDRNDDPADFNHIDSDEDSFYEVSDEIKIQIEQIQVDSKPIELTGTGPKILIYHSHTREAYRQDPRNPYKEASAEAFRSDDMNHTVVRVGEVLAQHLTSRGLAVLHDKTNHEASGYNASYSKSLKTLEKRMTEYESLQMFIDIHRNGYDKKSGKTPDDEVVIINGERVAKLLVVIGTGEGIMGGFKDKPKWKENAKLAIKLTNKINELYPGLAKDVYYKTGRYNQHVSTNAILVEVGSNLTTLAEAERAAKYLAEAISQIIE